MPDAASTTDRPTDGAKQQLQQAVVSVHLEDDDLELLLYALTAYTSTTPAESYDQDRVLSVSDKLDSAQRHLRRLHGGPS